jgi:hypothetical protein
MNEGFRIRLTRNGRLWRIQSLTADGIVMDGEKDAFPRRLRFEFDARSPVTARLMDRVRHLRDWKPFEFNFNVSVVDGTLRFTGEDPHSLPSGHYWMKCEADDLVLPRGRKNVDVERDDASFVLDLPAERDPRAIELTIPFAEFDGDILRPLQAPGTSLDGLAIDAWLKSDRPRESRKACLLNLLAKLRVVPTPKQALIAHLNSLFFAATDRVYGEVSAELFPVLTSLTKPGESERFKYEGTPKSATHRKLLTRVEQQGWGLAADYDLHSFRESGKFCMQAVVAVPRIQGRPHYAEFDIDLGNPLEDVQGFVIHMGELAGGKTTDHFKLRDKLAKAALKEFLYYRVV